ncbi:leucine-rich repeat-containing protein 51-like isoform X1 [Epinephelus fuscoguttatus]|uniref:leucine-rich repeat-containing protein 51-like isoform X1 n=1 Tax=Epinephelus fuscoguttatus TaxID=293821 RepID=UPI0020D185B3|nr:leucine-rich repeat-containing protein 51-like isoform X1 [Epinephelus fuscoguttatus]
MSSVIIEDIKGALVEEPRSGLRPLNTNSEGKYLSRSLRISYNNITDLTDLQNVLAHFLARPSQIGWLDLSFNRITHIDPVLCELRELRVLYLHGNGIWNLSEVDRLRELQYLHTITLHGNVIETNRKYRWRLHFHTVYTDFLPSSLTHTHILFNCEKFGCNVLSFAAIVPG